MFERRHPKRIVSEMQKALRPHKVFIDWSQNESVQDDRCPYSLRTPQRPTVSTP